MSGFSPEEIAHQEFLTRVGGYDKDEVRAFLQAVADDLRTALETQRVTTEETSLEQRAGALVDDTRVTITEMHRQLAAEVASLRNLRRDLEVLRALLEDAVTSAVRREETEPPVPAEEPPDDRIPSQWQELLADPEP